MIIVPLQFVHDCCNCLPHPFGRFLDFPVAEMGVAQRSAHVGMAEQTGDDRNRHAVHHRVAGMGVAEIVKANVLDARLAPGAVPERKVSAAGPGGISRGRKDERASAARPAFENAPGRGIEGNDPGARLAVGEDQPVAIDFRPAQPKDLAPAASGPAGLRRRALRDRREQVHLPHLDRKQRPVEAAGCSIQLLPLVAQHLQMGRKDKPAVRLKPSSYQPSKAEMEEDIGIDTTPEDLLRAVVCDVKIEYDENA